MQLSKLWVVLLIISPLLAQSQGILFETSDWEAVKTKAKELNKPIFVDTYASWCEPCKWMEQNTFSNQEVGTFFQANYVSYKLNIEDGAGAAFAEKYRVAAFPTLLYFDTEGNLVHRVVGTFSAADFIKHSKNALDPEQQIYTLEKRFKAGERETKFLWRYTEALTMIGERSYTKVADAYVETVGQSALTEAEHFAFIEHYILNYKDPAYRYVADNRATFAESLGAERVNNYLTAAFKSRCYELIDNQSDKSVIKDFLQDVKQVLPDQVDYFKTRISFYQKRGSKRDYRLAKQYEKHCKDAESIDAIARYILEIYGTNDNYLKDALQWSDRAIALKKNAYTLETKARILLALGDKDGALAIAEEQMAWSKENNNEYGEEIQALMDKIKQS